MYVSLTMQSVNQSIIENMTGQHNHLLSRIIHTISC